MSNKFSDRFKFWVEIGLTSGRIMNAYQILPPTLSIAITEANDDPKKGSSQGVYLSIVF